MKEQLLYSKYTKGLVRAIPHVGATIYEWLYGTSGQNSPSSNATAISIRDFLAEEKENYLSAPCDIVKSYSTTIRILRNFVRKYHAIRIEVENPFHNRFEDSDLRELMKHFDRFTMSYQRSYTGLALLLNEICHGDLLESRMKRLHALHHQESVSHGTSLKGLLSLAEYRDLEDQSFATVERALRGQHDMAKSLV